MAGADDAKDFQLKRSASHLLHRAQQLAADWFARNAGDDSVTLRQFAVLAAIAEKPGQNQTDLVRATGVDRSTLADMISRMEKRGWVSRKTAAKDARAKAVSLTGPGRRMLTAATPLARAADEALLGALPKTRRDAFLKTLEALAEAAEGAETPRLELEAAIAAKPPKAKPTKAKAKAEAPTKADKKKKPAKAKSKKSRK